MSVPKRTWHVKAKTFKKIINTVFQHMDAVK